MVTMIEVSLTQKMVKRENGKTMEPLNTHTDTHRVERKEWRA